MKLLMERCIMVDERRIRSLDLINQEILTTPINIIGAGAIGSWACLALAKMGFTDITVFDSDYVSIENVGIQIYGSIHIGMKKVDALQDLVKMLADMKIKVVAENYTKVSQLKGMTLVGVDSMRARRDIYNLHKKEFHHSGMYIDLRMGATQMLSYSYPNIFDCNYEITLYSDENALQERCTAKATIYTATIIGGIAARLTQKLLEEKEIYCMTANLKELVMM